MTLSQLIQRVEGATSASRELDALIHKAINPDQRVMFDHGKAFGRGPKREATYGLLRDFPMTNWDDWHMLCLHVGALPVTSSLDAAMSLVWEETTSIHFNRFECDVSIGDDPPDVKTMWSCTVTAPCVDFISGRGRSQALALTAAALRSLLASQGDSK